MDEITTDIICCARCGKTHLGLLFQKLDTPVESMSPIGPLTHWAPCPSNGQPILLNQSSKSNGNGPSGSAIAAVAALDRLIQTSRETTAKIQEIQEIQSSFALLEPPALYGVWMVSSADARPCWMAANGTDELFYTVSLAVAKAQALRMCDRYAARYEARQIGEDGLPL